MGILSYKDRRTIDEAFDMQQGYVLNFSNRTFEDYFDAEFGIDIYDKKYAIHGDSKAKRLRAFIEVASPYLVGKVLRSLWEYKENLQNLNEKSSHKPQRQKTLKTLLFRYIDQIENNMDVPKTDAFDNSAGDETLEELITAIERDVQANPAVALDRLHTYCMRKMAHLIERRGGKACNHNDPLHSRMGRYIKLLEQERPLREVSHRILKSSIGTLEAFNDVRNNESLAHDNNLVEHTEARLIYDSVTAILRFLKSVESDKFETN